MTQAYDLVIRGGAVVDGTGAPAFVADVAVKDGRIAAVGEIAGQGAEEIDATGRLVTPGFVDIHTHYDGHVTWTDRLYPSSKHGVTTVLMGNCGVGFAPCRAQDHERLVLLMEGVEDIPEVVMTAGLPWDWESFPDYLDRLGERRFDMDVAAQLPHAALRVFVMGERAVAKDPATPADIARMRQLAREAIEAGALGFSTSRSLNHRALDGTLTPAYGAAADELTGIALGLKDAGKGVLQLISDWDDVDSEMAIVRRMVAESGRPLATTVNQRHNVPDRWREVLDRIERASDDGLPIRAQVCGRPIGVLMGLDIGRNPFVHVPAYEEIAHLTPPERAAAMRDPERKRRILTGEAGATLGYEHMFLTNYANMYDYDEAHYEPALDQNLAARAAAAGVDPAEFTYDLLARGEGDTVIYVPSANFYGNRLDAIEVLIRHKDTIWALGDGGAHCSLLCDASLTTWYLERWVEANGGPLSLEYAVQSLTSKPAASVGLHDRGVVAPGYRADLNVIDLAKARVGRPTMIYDLPTGAKRLDQPAGGYEATIVAGQVTYRDGVPTGALPGRLVRGAQSAPAGA
jgi:N-acyl-D-aspartate/D-glutamate deacylase